MLVTPIFHYNFFTTELDILQFSWKGGSMAQWLESQISPSRILEHARKYL